MNSPPYFCAATKTLWDLANASIKVQAAFKAHPLDEVSEPLLPPEPCMPPPCNASSKLAALPEAVDVSVAYQAARPVAARDVYVDDFFSLAQGNSKRRRQVKRPLFEALDSVFQLLLMS
jgi:hypothetical protein